MSTWIEITHSGVIEYSDTPFTDDEDDENSTCPHCDGTGQMLWRSPEQAGGVGEETTCEYCDGTGKL